MAQGDQTAWPNLSHRPRQPRPTKRAAAALQNAKTSTQVQVRYRGQKTPPIHQRECFRRADSESRPANRCSFGRAGQSLNIQQVAWRPLVDNSRRCFHGPWNAPPSGSNPGFFCVKIGLKPTSIPA